MSTQKIAVAVIHGIGEQDKNFANAMITEITNKFAKQMKKSVSSPEKQLVIKPIYWADLLNKRQTDLWGRLAAKGKFDYLKIRKFIINAVSDAFAYQPVPDERELYDSIHYRFAEALNYLAVEAGADAPLYVLAHSLGSVIASNYLYDLSKFKNSKFIAPRVRDIIKNNPLERGKTLTRFITFGSPLVMWSLRYEDFGRPIDVPSPKLKNYYPKLKGGWFNFYDEDDLLGFPLKPINPAYNKAIKKDQMIQVGFPIIGATPLSHLMYWTDNSLTNPIVKYLVQDFKLVNS